MRLARRLAGVLAAAAILPALFWLGPALVDRLAPSFRDQGDFFYPLKLYTADRLRAGDIPLWNPFSGVGEPWLASGQAGVFYPPTALFLLPSPAAAGILFLLLHFAVAAWGMRQLLIEEGVSATGAFFGSAVFASSGFAASLSAFWNHFGAWAYLPAIVWMARSGVKTRGALLGLAALFGLQAMAGSPEMSAMTAIVALALSVARRRNPETAWRDSLGRSLLRAVGGIAFGVAIAAWVLVPMGELAFHSERRGALAVEEREPGAVALAVLAGSLASPPSATRTFWIPSLFVGPLVLVAAAVAFLERERRRLAIVLAALGLAGLLVAAAGLPGEWLRSLPPLDRIRYPEKGLAISIFALAVLSGMGLDALRFRGGTRELRVAYLFLAAAGAFVALAFSAPPLVRAATAIGLAAIAALAVGWGRRPRPGSLLAGLAALALVASYAVANRSLFTFVAESEIRRRPQVHDAIGKFTGRVLTPPPADLARWIVRDGSFDAGTLARQREALAGYTNLLFGIPTVRTPAALATAGARTIADSIDRSQDPVRAGGPASVRIFWSPYRPMRLPSRKAGDFYRAPVAPYRPRLSFVRSYDVETDPVRAWQRVASGEIDLSREILLGREPAPRPAPGEQARLLIARLSEDLPERVVAEITTNSAGLLVLTDLFYPGWIAEEGERRLEMLRADGSFRAVALPAGTHRVTFRYRPLSFFVGAGISIAALLAALWLAYQGEPILIGRRG